MFKLILKFQDTVLQEYKFEHTPVTIGRRDGNDIAIDNMAVSGRHAHIEMEDPGQYVLVDLESLNGTYISEKKVAREVLHDGDEVLIGKHHLVFVDLDKPGTKDQAKPEVSPDGLEKPIPEKHLSEKPVPEKPHSEKPPRKKTKEPTTAGSASQGPSDGSELTDGEPKLQPSDEAAPPADVSETELPPLEAPLIAMDEPPPIPKTRRPELKGTLTILSGGGPQILDLTKMVTTMGKSDEADVKCSGLLIGKTAAIINKTPYGFFLKYNEGTKKPYVNGEGVSSQIQLQDGDEIAIGSTRMTFNVTEGS